MAKTKVLYIEWNDICSWGSWQDKDRARCPLLKCRTVGMFLQEDNNTISVYQSEGKNGTVGDIITIPKSVITKKKILAYVE